MTTSKDNVGAPASVAMSRVQNAPNRPRAASPKDNLMKPSSYRLALATACACITTLSACSDKRGAEAVVRDAMTDPDSAKFGTLYFNEKTQKGCLTVNGKNQMGGYTGDQQAYVRRAKDGSWSQAGIAPLSLTSCRSVYADYAD